MRFQNVLHSPTPLPAAVVLILSFSSMLPAQSTTQLIVPEYHQEVYPEISVAEVKIYVQQKTSVLFDARNEEAYREGHIPGALSLPPTSDFESAYARVKAKLEADKSQSIVVYCTNHWCPLSDTLYDKLRALGYGHVKVFRNGINGWQQAGLTVVKSPQ